VYARALHLLDDVRSSAPRLEQNHHYDRRFSDLTETRLLPKPPSSSFFHLLSPLR